MTAPSPGGKAYVGRSVSVGLNAVIVAVTDEVPRILTVEVKAFGDESEDPALPYGPLDPLADRTLEKGLRGWVREQTGLEIGYVEQLYTFGDLDRDPELGEADRQVSLAYLALVHEHALAEGVSARWRDCYRFLPWEDWRGGRPRLLNSRIVPALEAWAGKDKSGDRRERVEIAFGHGSGQWDEERCLERYELLWEAGLVAEAERSGRVETTKETPRFGTAMALDHRRMLATAISRLRGKLKYRPLVFELMPQTFTLLQLQRLVEALSGVRLHKQNFRRLVERGGLVEGTGQMAPSGVGRPAELFRFRREVVRERPAPGVGLPGTRTV